MKKKAIETVPYLGLKKLSKKKMALYIGVVAWKIIDHERHIFLEVYKNKKGCKDIPVVRYAATKKDWGIYEPKTGTWSRRKIDSYDWGCGLCWYEQKQKKGRDWKERRQCNILSDAKDLERIKKFFAGIQIYDDADWWEYFAINEDSIRFAEQQKKYKRRQERLTERITHTPEIDEKKLLEYADRCLFWNKHYLYYKKRGRKADVCCSACGGVSHGSFKPGESYESNFEHFIEEPREGHIGHCQLCGASGVYKCQGKSGRAHGLSKYLFLIDKYRETGAVVRYFELEKEWQLEEICGETGAEMHGAYEKLSGVEIARTYFAEDGKVQTDFHKYGSYVGDFWDDCNLSGMSNITIEAAHVHPASFENIKGTCLQYSAVKEYVAALKRDIDVKKYMERYRELPQIEVLVKIGLTEVVSQIIGKSWKIDEYIVDKTASNITGMFGIKKEHEKLLIKHNGNVDLLGILQIEKKLSMAWTDEQCQKLAICKPDRNKLITILKHMTVQKFLNRVEKYVGVEIGSDLCGMAYSNMIHTSTTYVDYLSMRDELGYDMSNTVYLYPKNLEIAHREMVLESQKEELDKRKAEVSEKYSDIKRRYRSLRKKYFFEDAEMVIRPARSAEEIVEEGRILHHCVGGNGYLGKHNRGESAILFLRFKKSLNTPYITVEIKDDRIIQWYGAYDKKPDQENMQKWLDEYVGKLKGNSGEVVEDIAQIAG